MLISVSELSVTHVAPTIRQSTCWSAWIVLSSNRYRMGAHLHISFLLWGTMPTSGESGPRSSIAGHSGFRDRILKTSTQPWEINPSAGADLFQSLAASGRYAISRELALTAPGGDNGSRRTILCGDDPAFVLYRVGQRFGLPVVPQWADWFMKELQGRKAVAPLTGLGCSPVVVKGTGKAFLHWIGTAVKRRAIELPETKRPISWPSFDGILGLSSAGQTTDSCN
jgi:hypothetical protein